jgi:hypothetical protein
MDGAKAPKGSHEATLHHELRHVKMMVELPSALIANITPSLGISAVSPFRREVKLRLSRLALTPPL